MADKPKFIMAYYKHDGGFGYDALFMTDIPGVGGYKDHRLRSMGGEYQFKSLEALSERLKERTNVVGYANMVGDDALAHTENPAPLEDSVNRNLIKMLHS